MEEIRNKTVEIEAKMRRILLDPFRTILVHPFRTILGILRKSKDGGFLGMISKFLMLKRKNMEVVITRARLNR